MADKKDAGAVIRQWLTEKMGNPILTSKKKRAIAEIEKADALDHLQENGEDYNAKVHTKPPTWKVD